MEGILLKICFPQADSRVKLFHLPGGIIPRLKYLEKREN